MNSVEAYIQFEQGLITDDGRVTDEAMKKFLRKYMAEFHGFVTRVCMVFVPRSADAGACLEGLATSARSWNISSGLGITGVSGRGRRPLIPARADRSPMASFPGASVPQ